MSKIFTSRTNWMILFAFIASGVVGVHGMIPAGLATILDGVLSIAAIYFKMNPSQTYGDQEK